MKKILYFLIGFSLVVFPAHYVYAASGECLDASLPTEHANYPGREVVHEYYGHHPNYQTANVAIPGGSTAWADIECPDGSIIKRGHNWWVSTPMIFRYGTAYGDAPFWDADGDGLEDDLDFYPYDPTPYKYKVVSETYNKITNEVVYRMYQTDRGDFFSLGDSPDWTDPQTNEDYQDTISISPTWSVQEDIKNDSLVALPPATQTTTTVSTVNTTTLNTIINNTKVTGSIGGVAPTIDGGFSVTPSPDAPETGIIAGPDATQEEKDNINTDNTAKTTINTAIQADYLKSIDARLAEMNTRASLQSPLSRQDMDDIVKKYFSPLSGEAGEGGEGGEGDGEPTEDEQEVTAGHGAWDALNPASYYNEDTMPTTITEGVEGDFVKPGKLEDETFMIGFLANNPIKTAFDSSGFNLISPVCQMTLDLGSMGNHTMSLCEFESQFAMAGQILFGITALLSLFIVARGM